MLMGLRSQFKYFISISVFLTPGLLSAEVLPTSSTKLTNNGCQLNFFHLEKGVDGKYKEGLRVSLVTDNIYQHRYVAMKADINRPLGFENINYNRAGKPTEVFSVNWRKQKEQFTYGRLMLLAGTSDRQAFDDLKKLITQDKGHFELEASKQRYRFNANATHLDDFLACEQKRTK
ncbi:hypothetical protein [Photobacterium profundum]|uniref:hypothetical protein n=1 Tax=Photobacterium profundum TaxID=74109 RepID=UPI003D142D5B